MFRVAEKFVSINGEGEHAGCMAAFIRLVGCNLQCSWCDTRWACQTDCECEELSAQELAEWAESTGAKCVTLTGGEPLLAPNVNELLRALLSPANSLEVIEVETNGSIQLDGFTELREIAPGKLHFTMDYKLPESGMNHRMAESNFKLLGEGDVVKFVAASREDLDCMRQVVESQLAHSPAQAFVSPVFGSIQPAEIVDYLLEHKLNQIRMQLQLHKIIWPNVEKGV